MNLPRSVLNISRRFQKPLSYRLIAVAIGMGLAAGPLFASPVTCAILHGAPQDPAHLAMADGRSDKAVPLFQEELEEHPNDTGLAAGLVAALLQQQDVAQADATVQSALARNPKSSVLVSARGEVEYREGFPWKAAQSAIEAAKLDPCSPTNMLLIAKIARLNSDYATAARSATNAHLLRPDDPAIRRDWIRYLPAQQQIVQLETDLSQGPSGDSDNPLKVRRLVNHLTQIDYARLSGCHLVSKVQSATIPLSSVGENPSHPVGIAMDLQLNGHAARLQVDTGADGLVITRDMARRAGLTRIGRSHLWGVGSGKRQAGFFGYAESIRIGGLDFRNCFVNVVDSKERQINGVDGLLGMDVFEPFLVTLDFPKHTLLLDPLPEPPGHAARMPHLDTGQSAIRPPGEISGLVESGASDRYIAPQMKNYTPVYRIGEKLMLPVSLNLKELGLFVIDTGAWTTAISPQAAGKVTELRSAKLDLHGISGKVDKAYTATHLTLRFADMVQQESNVVSFDMSNISRDMGIEVSGFLGADTLGQTTLHIDYRDGLVKFDYAPPSGQAH